MWQNRALIVAWLLFVSACDNDTANTEDESPDNSENPVATSEPLYFADISADCTTAFDCGVTTDFQTYRWSVEHPRVLVKTDSPFRMTSDGGTRDVVFACALEAGGSAYWWEGELSAVHF